ncbi:hypothetical protein F0U44_08610 [Nocardioides humilatus]|uniref:Uncharacterized protein n=1 Tax=Nocardioides humilatus TaxID=2607660 RepID=A0A5B1LFK1_9ACTN|nr:hypothetical protein [Nocardioides humilatus]KAA1418560.1 hypothetical protein F0U44_08610 [Nocardioides humilatus]
MTPEEYVAATGQRMAADGCEVGPDQVGRMPALVGIRKDFLAIALSRIHLVTAVAAFPQVTYTEVHGFTSDVSAYAKQRTGALRGLQSGVGAFAVLVSDQVAPEAIAAATAKPKIEFATEVRPAVVDLSTGVVHAFTGSKFFGAALNGHLRRKLQAYVVPPLQH